MLELYCYDLAEISQKQSRWLAHGSNPVNCNLDIISIKAGKNFEIVEINGAGSEATHIWDANTKLMEAYRTLFLQWNLLFRIGHEVRKRPNQKLKVHLFQFLKECLKVIFRKDELTISS